MAHTSRFWHTLDKVFCSSTVQIWEGAYHALLQSLLQATCYQFPHLPAIPHIFEQRSHGMAARVTVGKTKRRKSQAWLPWPLVTQPHFRFPNETHRMTHCADFPVHSQQVCFRAQLNDSAGARPTEWEHLMRRWHSGVRPEPHTLAMGSGFLDLPRRAASFKSLVLIWY